MSRAVGRRSSDLRRGDPWGLGQSEASRPAQGPAEVPPPADVGRRPPLPRWLRAVVVAQRALLDLAALAGAVCGLVFLACLATGSRAAIVISGSMEPSYPVGSLTFSRRVPARSLHIGDVVTVPRNDGNGLVTHRVVDVADGDGKPAFVLKGDANQHPDPLPYDIDEAGLVVACLPLVGYAVSWTQSHLFTTLALLAVVTFCALFPARALCAPDARSPTGGPARRAASSSTPPPGQPPPGGRHGAAPPASAPHSPRASRW